MTSKVKEKTEDQETASVQSLIGEANAAPKYKKEELLAIFDEIIFSGEYVEEVPIKDGKLKVSFRSRSVDDTMLISQDVDTKNFTLITTLQEYRALMNLAYSMVSYAGKDLSKLTIEDRSKFLRKLPATVASLLSNELVKFDAKVAAACGEGEANF